MSPLLTGVARFVLALQRSIPPPSVPISARPSVANDVDNLATLCANCHRRAEAALGRTSALSGLGNVLRNLAPLFLMCDPRDLSLSVESRARSTKLPTLTLYERVPGGPLTLVIERPDGVEFRRAVLPDQGAGGRTLALTLNSAVPTGTWRARAFTTEDSR